MGLFNKPRNDVRTDDYINNQRTGVIDRIKFDGPADSIVWKFPYDNLSIGTQLIVNESQEAILYKGGQAFDSFGPGTHTLSTGNIPLLQKLINLPFGGKSPFTAEVWYINKTVKRDIKWGTQDAFKIQDPNYKIIVPVRAFGEFGIQILDARNYMTKIVGTLHTSDIQTILKHFKTLIITKTKDSIAGFIVKQKISVLELPAMLDVLSNVCRQRITEEFDKYGILITNFYIESVNYPEDDLSVVKLQDALAKKAEMDIVGFNYQQERTFDTLETAAGNEGNSGSVMGTGMGLGIGLGVGNAFGNSASQMGNQLKPDQQPTKKCHKCATENSIINKFCSSCGAKMEIIKIKCYKCGKDNDEGTKFCSECGTNVTEVKCSKCGTSNSPRTKFCKECGEKLD